MRKTHIALGVLALALVAPAIPATAATTPSARPDTGGASVSEVLLPTGDTAILRHTADGASAASVLPAGAGIGHTYLGLTLHGDHYEIPASAVPYLDNSLDPSLFDVTALAANKNAASQVRANGTVLNPSSARQFGAALTKKYLADKSKPSSGARTATSANPNFVMHTVTVAGNDTNGKPDTGAFVVLANVDDSARFEATNEMYQGTAKFSVPAGTYFAAVVYFDTDAEGNITAEHDVIDSQLTVSGDQTVQLNANRATSQLAMVTPRPALNSGGSFYIDRDDANGRLIGLQLSFGAGVPVWVSPQPKPVTVGSMESYPQVWLTSPPAPGTPYVYNLQYATSGIIPAQRYVIKAKDLATLNNTFYSDYPTSGLLDVTTTFPFEAKVGAFAEQTVLQNMPAAETIYVPGDPTISRGTESIKYSAISDGVQWFYGMQTEQPTNFHAGRIVTENFNQFPLHPAADVDPGAPANVGAFLIPGATRSGDTESFYLAPFSDNTPGHSGTGFYGDPRDTISGNWELDQNGTKIAGAPISGGDLGDFVFDGQAPVSADPSTLHLTLDANRSGPMYELSTASHTEWTWHSTHQQGTTLSAPWSCTDVTPGNDCAVEPLMTVGYAVNNMDGYGIVSPEIGQGVDLTFGHIGGAASSAITDATVQYSTDDGATWQNATVTDTGNGTYHASYVINAIGGTELVSLKVTAHDAAGGALTETTTRAYKLD